MTMFCPMLSFLAPRQACHRLRSDVLSQSADLADKCANTTLCATMQLQACRSRILELEGLVQSAEARLQHSESRIEVLAAERDAIARNLVTAEAELNDVGEYSTKIFRQVSKGRTSCLQKEDGPA